MTNQVPERVLIFESAMHCDQKYKNKPQLAKDGFEPTTSRDSTEGYYNHSATELVVILETTLKI